MRKIANKGFTLVELIMVIVVLSIAGTALASVFAQMPRSLGLNEDVQMATQVGQGCAEYILTRRRRDLGYAGIVTGLCDAPFTVNGFDPNDVVTDPYAGPGCPGGGANCKLVTITTSNGSISSTVDLMITDY